MRIITKSFATALLALAPTLVYANNKVGSDRTWHCYDNSGASAGYSCDNSSDIPYKLLCSHNSATPINFIVCVGKTQDGKNCIDNYKVLNDRELDKLSDLGLRKAMSKAIGDNIELHCLSMLERS